MDDVLEPDDCSSRAGSAPFLVQLRQQDGLKTTACFALALQSQWPFIKESGFALLVFNKYFLPSVCLQQLPSFLSCSIVQIPSILALSEACFR